MDGQHRHAQEIGPALDVENGERLQTKLLQREIRELRRFATSENRHAAIGRSAFANDRPQVLPHLAVQVQRIVHEFVRETQFFGNPTWSE